MPKAGAAFLKIPPLTGGSLDKWHRDEIELATFSWGAGGRGAADDAAGVRQFTFAAAASSASPGLFLACAQAQHFKEAVLTVRTVSGAGDVDYLVVRLQDVVVTSYQTGAQLTQDGRVMDEVSLDFRRIEIRLQPLRPDGSPGGLIVVNWDVATKAPY